MEVILVIYYNSVETLPTIPNQDTFSIRIAMSPMGLLILYRIKFKGTSHVNNVLLYFFSAQRHWFSTSLGLQSKKYYIAVISFLILAVDCCVLYVYFHIIFYFKIRAPEV